MKIFTRQTAGWTENTFVCENKIPLRSGKRAENPTPFASLRAVHVMFFHGSIILLEKFYFWMQMVLNLLL